MTRIYNWTRNAEKRDEEKLMVMDAPFLAERFAEEFNRIWHNSDPVLP